MACVVWVEERTTARSEKSVGGCGGRMVEECGGSLKNAPTQVKYMVEKSSLAWPVVFSPLDGDGPTRPFPLEDLVRSALPTQLRQQSVTMVERQVWVNERIEGMKRRREKCGMQA